MQPWDDATYLQGSGDDYLSSLQDFLQGNNNAFPSTLPPPLPSLDAYNLDSSSKGFPDLQVNPSLLNGYPGLPALNTAGSQNEPSSPELTSASDSGASPASSADAPAPAPTTARARANSARRTGSGGANVHVAGVNHDKRKAQPSGTGAVKDRKSTGGAGAQTHHSHPVDHDGELERSESPELPAGKGGKSKTSEKRRAQNRQAQRNFRERKEKHLRDLETRVLDLEQQQQDKDSENSALKALLEQLQSENARLKVFESAFSFNYDKDVSNSSAMPQSADFAGLPSLPSVPGAMSSSVGGMPQKVDGSKLPTPPATVQNDDPTAFKFDTSPLGFGLNPSTGFVAGVGARSASSSASPASAAPASASLYSPGTQAQQDDLFASFTLPSPPVSLSTPSVQGSSAQPSPAGTNAQFTSYRDPLALLGSTVQQPAVSTFADLDALFGVPGATGASPAATAMGGMLSSYGGGGSTGATPSAGLDDPLLAAFLAPSPGGPAASLPLGASPSMLPASNLPSPLAFPSSSSSGSSPATTALEGTAGGLGAGPGMLCSIFKEAAMEQAKKEGRKFEFDLDGLCSEMKLKATCQEAARAALKSAMAEDAAASAMAYPGRQL
ncbi:hypothetical protein JCM8097_006494 [Rhodosporidiobolus ruineniae]